MKNIKKLFLTSTLFALFGASFLSAMETPNFSACTTPEKLEETFIFYEKQGDKITSLNLDVHNIAKLDKDMTYGYKDDTVSQLPKKLAQEIFPKLQKLSVTTHDFNVESTVEKIATDLPLLEELKIVTQDPDAQKGLQRFRRCIRQTPSLPENFTPENLKNLTRLYLNVDMDSTALTQIAQFSSLEVLALSTVMINMAMYYFKEKYFTENNFPKLKTLYVYAYDQDTFNKHKRDFDEIKKTLPNLTIEPILFK